MKTVIQKVIGTIASAYSRKSSVAIRGASGCVTSRSCTQDSTSSRHAGTAVQRTLSTSQGGRTQVLTIW